MKIEIIWKLEIPCAKHRVHASSHILNVKEQIASQFAMQTPYKRSLQLRCKRPPHQTLVWGKFCSGSKSPQIKRSKKQAASRQKIYLKLKHKLKLFYTCNLFFATFKDLEVVIPWRYSPERSRRKVNLLF